MRPIIAPLSLIQEVREFADPLPLKLMPRFIAAPFKQCALNRVSRAPFPVRVAIIRDAIRKLQPHSVANQMLVGVDQYVAGGSMRNRDQ
jgi:hypothetical protein